MFPFSHSHVGKFLLVCRNFDKPYTQIFPGSNVTSSGPACATHSRSDHEGNSAYGCRVQGEIQVLASYRKQDARSGLGLPLLIAFCSWRLVSCYYSHFQIYATRQKLEGTACTFGDYRARSARTEPEDRGGARKSRIFCL